MCWRCLLASSAAFANDATLQPGLTGDWSGARTDLANEGWQFQVKGDFRRRVESDPAAITNPLPAQANWISWRLADLGKLIGDDGGSIEANITKRFGANLVNVAGLNTLMQPQEIYGRGDIWRLTQFSFAQDLLARRSTSNSGG